MIKVYKAEDYDKKNAADSGNDSGIEAAVDAIIEAVKREGDAALLKYTERFDGAKLNSLLVTEAEINDAYNAQDADFINILARCRDNIALFHKKQLKEGFEIKKEDGVILGQRCLPLKRVGLYIPGGTASYPSTVLMNAVPAKIAGVEEIILATPPGKDGKVAKVILAAAKVAGVDKIYKMGGAQAVAALAFGTETVPKVDKITGPGNIYVATAKRKLFGVVDIDMIAGPSDILIIADDTAIPAFVAADMLSQAEHDKLASAVLVTDSEKLIESVKAELKKQLPLLERSEIAAYSIENNGMIILTKDLDESIDVANRIAPEHLELCIKEPFGVLDRIRNAGSVFLGNNTPEALGDYYAGPNHTLPTNGTARFSSPLSVDDFIKKTSYIYYTKEALEKAADTVAGFAEREGLGAHAKSVTIRLKKQ